MDAQYAGMQKLRPANSRADDACNHCNTCCVPALYDAFIHQRFQVLLETTGA